MRAISSTARATWSYKNQRVQLVLDFQPVDQTPIAVSPWGATVARWKSEGHIKEGEDIGEHWERSPLKYVGNVKTPTMLMTGVLDLRTPIPQIEEFYRALKVHGTPTVMVRMNNEYHGTSSTPSNFLRTQLYLRSWFDRWGTKSAGQATTSDSNRQ